MDIELLLKSISDLIKKNEHFFVNNPEIFKIVEGRLHKAIDYEDYQGEEDMDDEDYYNDAYDDAEISSMFDDIPESDIDEDMDGELEEDEAAQWLAENDANLQGEEDIDGDGDIDISPEAQQAIQETDAQTDAVDAQAEPAKRRKSRRSEWAAKDMYEPHHQEAIDKYMAEGWSHREAERMAGAHDTPSNFFHAMNYHVKPSANPSENMRIHMKEKAGEWLRNANKLQDASAEASRNPIKHASSKTLTAHSDAHGEFKAAYDKFLEDIDSQDLDFLEHHEAIENFKKKWHEDNPEYRENAIMSADAGKTLGSAMDERKKYLEEGKQAILSAGQTGGDMATSGQFSEAAAGGTGDLSSQAAAQMAGGAQDSDSGGYSTSVVKDPHAHFAEKYPDYVKHLRSKLEGKLDPQQAQRLKGIQGFKKKGSE